jgi:hypothetical protein
MVDELRSAHFKLAYAEEKTDYKSQAAISHQPYECQYDN